MIIRCGSGKPRWQVSNANTSVSARMHKILAFIWVIVPNMLWHFSFPFSQYEVNDVVININIFRNLYSRKFNVIQSCDNFVFLVDSESRDKIDGWSDKLVDVGDFWMLEYKVVAIIVVQVCWL